MAKCKHCGNRGKVSGAGLCPNCTAISIAKSREKYKDRDMAKEFGELSAKRREKDEDTETHIPSIPLFQPSKSEEVRCPKCGSTSISADKKGFGIGKAVVGAAVAGPIGLAAGGIGARKVRITCLNCGHQWIAGKG